MKAERAMSSAKRKNTVEAGFGGLECLSGIPGSAGATPVQNVGAYGVEVADYLSRVRLLDRRSSEVRWVVAAGKLLKDDYRLTTLDAERIGDQILRLSSELDRYKQQVGSLSGTGL